MRSERVARRRLEAGGMHTIRCMCCCALSDWLHALLPSYVTLLPSQGGIYFAGQPAESLLLLLGRPQWSGELGRRFG